MNRKPIVLLIALTLTVATTVAQDPDSVSIASAKQHAIRIYTESIGPNSHLYNGSDYKEYISQDEESPMLYDDVVTGNVFYDGELYTDVALYYDIEKDLVLTSYPHGNKVQLLSDFVDYFEMDGHHYVRLTDKKINVGFYDRLYDGTMKLYARRIKVHLVHTSVAETIHEFDPAVKYYIEKDGVYHQVKSKRSVLRLMQSQKHGLKKTIRDEHIDFHNNREQAITRLLERFEDLNVK